MFDHKPSRQDDSFIRKHLEGQLTEREFRVIEDRMRVDPAFRRRYVEIVDLDARLYETYGGAEPIDPTAALSAHQHRERRIRAGLLGMLAMCALIAVIAFLPQSNESDLKLPGSIAVTPTSVPPETMADPTEPGEVEQRSRFEAYPSPISQDCAVIVSTHGVDGDGLKAGGRLRPGLLKLVSGKMQLEFICGAKVMLTAPAKLEIQSDKAAKLYEGALAAQLPERALGFVVNSPKAAVVDRGTEFSMSVGNDGGSNVRVNSGAVDLSAIGDDGNTITTRRLFQNETMRVDQSRQISKIQDDAIDSFPSLEAPLQVPLAVTDEYVRTIKGGLPVVYWRFSERTDNSIPNEMGDHHPGKLIFPQYEPETLSIANGHVTFSKSVLPRYILCEEAFPDLNLLDYSIEFWIRPDDLGHSTCFVTCPVENPDHRQIMNLIDIATNTMLVHDPGSFRFLHRYPPHLDHPAGFNVFTRGVCAPQRWQHVVAVRSGDRIEIFHNGMKYGSVTMTDPIGPGDFQFLLGQLNTIWTWRQFNGAMDEFAFYTRALGSDEIRHHYQLLAEEG